MQGIDHHSTSRSIRVWVLVFVCVWLAGICLWTVYNTHWIQFFHFSSEYIAMDICEKPREKSLFQYK